MRTSVQNNFSAPADRRPRAVPTVSGPTRRRTGGSPYRHGAHDMTAEPLVTFLVAQPTAADALLAAHVDDARGRCRGCSSGSGRVGPTWPCILHDAAAAALRIRQQREAAR